MLGTAPMASDQPLIVQGVDTLLLEVASPRFEEARSQLLAFAELIKAPNTSTPTVSPPCRSGTRAPPASPWSRSSLPCANSAATGG